MRISRDPPRKRFTSLLAACVCGLSVCRVAPAAPIVIANRTEAPIRIVWSEIQTAPSDSPVIAAQIDLGSGKPSSSESVSGDRSTRQSARASFERDTIQPGEITVLRVEPASRARVRWDGADAHELDPYSAYYFGPSDQKRIELRQIGLGDLSHTTGAATVDRERVARLHQPGSAADDSEQRRTIRVALYVDDEEAGAKPAWQKRLRDRLAAASEIIERSCGLKLEVASYGQWQSTDGVTEFHQSLGEFERSVKPRNARLAIGFTSQYQLTQGRTHLGGTRGPLASHILLREWSKHVSEPERLELLVHEICHFLGAAHSPESVSVMRPLLGDRQARLKRFAIAVDPVNALVMNLVADELRDRGVVSFGQISDSTIARLRIIYQVLTEAMPDDPAAKDYVNFLDQRAALRKAAAPVAP